jgi:hypothetical protein
MLREQSEALSPRLTGRWQRFEASSDAYAAVAGLLLLMIVVPIIETPVTGSISFLLAVIAGGAATLALAASLVNRWAIRLSLLAWIVAVVGAVLPGSQRTTVTASAMILGAFLMFAPLAIIRRISRHERITATTVWGAIAAYLAVGIAFSIVYSVLFELNNEGFTPMLEGGMGVFNYFSFVTMTTLGYGDITPATELTRAVVVLQTVIGQIFLVVVVARVVALLGTGRTFRAEGNEESSELR